MRKHHEERFVGEKRNRQKIEKGRGRKKNIGWARKEKSRRWTRRTERAIRKEDAKKKREKERKVSKRGETGERIGGRRDELP